MLIPIYEIRHHELCWKSTIDDGSEVLHTTLKIIQQISLLLCVLSLCDLNKGRSYLVSSISDSEFLCMLAMLILENTASPKLDWNQDPSFESDAIFLPSFPYKDRSIKVRFKDMKHHNTVPEIL